MVGDEAKKLFADAQAMLKNIIDEKWLGASAVIGLFPANSVGDDIEIYTDEVAQPDRDDLPHPAPAEPRSPPASPTCAWPILSHPRISGVKDYIGAFAVTAGIGIDARVAEFEKNHDDYSAIMLKALADRLAEAFAELLHERVRREFWGYAKDEALSNEDLIEEKYRGIRPAPGYPACPEHSEKGPLFELLQAPENAGITLTESFAMLPTAAVSGFYFAHPESTYFAVGQDRPRPGGGLRPAQGLGPGRRRRNGWRRIWGIRTRGCFTENCRHCMRFRSTFHTASRWNC